RAGDAAVEAAVFSAHTGELATHRPDHTRPPSGPAGADLVNGGRGNDAASLGAGDDTFVWNPGDGSDTVEGGDGNDTMLFNGANMTGRTDLSAPVTRLPLFRASACIKMDTHGVEQR